MNALALLFALTATSGTYGCAGGTCAAPAMTYSYPAPTTYASAYQAPHTAPAVPAYAPQPAYVAQPTYAPQPTYTPQPAPAQPVYTPQPVYAPQAGYYNSGYAAPLSYAGGCAGGSCAR